MYVIVKKEIAIKGIKSEIKVLEGCLKTLLPKGDDEAIDTSTVRGFQLTLRVGCIKSNIAALKDQLTKMEKA